MTWKRCAVISQRMDIGCPPRQNGNARAGQEPRRAIRSVTIRASWSRFAWSKKNSRGSTHLVRKKQPNAWGLYDMHGNVAEWCNDYYADAYEAGPAQDPAGPESGEDRVLRGGSWKTSDESCRSSARYGEAPGWPMFASGYEAYGFRCVRAVHDQGEEYATK